MNHNRTANAAFSLLAIAIGSQMTSGAMGPRVVDGGQISGTSSKDPAVQTFRGIPYAAPPVGGLRWRAPQSVKAWSGVRSAAEYAPQCLGRNFGYLPPAGVSEDCLYLNVWTSAQRGNERMPVMVWIHGGGFQGGGGYHPAYEGENLAKRGIVVVTFNYRVSIFGFLAHPELTRESGTHASGHYGFLDQVAVLRWVQRNIEQFGGDPAKVTIAGESAGSVSVSALTASPMARNLFRAAIAQSGAYLSPQSGSMRSLRDGEEVGVDFGRALGAPDIASLRKKDAGDLMKAVAGLPDFFAFQPGVDGHFLTESVYSTYAKQQQASVPVLIGSNTDEGAFMMPPARPAGEEFEAQLRRIYGENHLYVRYAYPTETQAELLRSELNLYADTNFTYPMWKWAQMHRQVDLPVYVYLFGRTLPVLPDQTYKGVARGLMGAFHGDEVPYAFGNINDDSLALDGLSRKGRWESVDRVLSNAMSQYWVNFVKTGDPNGQGLPVWPIYGGSSGDALLYLDARLQVKLDDRTSRMKVLDAALQTRQK